MNQELLLLENPYRYSIFPIQYADIWDMVQLHRASLWKESEIDLTKDIEHWNKLTQDEQHFIKYVLAFFASSDGIVLENLAIRFMKEIQIPEVRSFYTVQMVMETIHGITYSQLIDTYVKDQNEKLQLFRAIDTVPVVQKKALWAQKWIESSESLATRLVAFACVEGIFFSGSFCCIYWLKDRALMPGLAKSNEFISRDEGIHCEFSILLYTKYIQNKLSLEITYEIIQEAVDIEEEFIINAIPCKLLGMNSEMMRMYIKFVANRLLTQLGYEKLFKNIKQPFSFMDRICIDSKENFFETRTTNYQMEVGFDENELIFDEEF